MNDFFKILKREFKGIATNIPILIVLILGNVGYGFLYNIMYDTNVYRDAPIAVVDMSQSSLSQHIIDYINSTEQVDVIATTMDFHHAKKMLAEREVIGFLYIPQELTTDIMRGEQAQCVVYGSTLSFIDYLNISEAVNYSLLEINSELLPDIVKSLNMIDVLFLANGKPIDVVSEPLYNSSEGYGSYLIPPVLMIIIFQTLMITVSMMCGIENERQRLNSEFIVKSLRRRKSLRFIDIFTSSANIVFGKAFVNVAIYSIFSIFFLCLLPMLFNLPHLSNYLNIIILMIPYLFTSVFFCLMMSPLFIDGDMPLFIIVFMSVPLVFISGISYPLELMPWHWKIMHYVIPSAPATMAFVKSDCMGAALTEMKPELVNLWVQCITYCIAALTVWYFIIKKKIKKPDDRSHLVNQ